MMKTAKISTMGALTAAMLLAGIGLAQAQTILEASHTVASAGETGHEITVSFTNTATDEIGGYEFQFPIPPGYLGNISVMASDPEVDPACAIPPNANRMLCMAIANSIAALPPHALSIRVDIDAGAPDGVIPLAFEGVLFSDPDANSLPVNPDSLVNGSITIAQPPVYSSSPAPGSVLDESAAPGDTVQFSVVISNSGGDGLDYDCSVSGAGFSIASGGSASDMAAGASGTVVASAAAPAAGSAITGALSCTHNDPASASPAQYTLNLSAPLPPTRIFCDGFEAGGDGGCAGQEIVFVDNVNLVFAQDETGSAINWLTGDICNCDAGAYHFNIWQSNGALAFYFPIRVEGETGAVANAEGVVMVLQSGDTIGPQASYTVGDTPTHGAIAAAWRQASGVQGYLGFRFLNADTGEVNYGYAEMTTTGVTGYPAAIHRYWFNAAGNPITIP